MDLGCYYSQTIPCGSCPALGSLSHCSQPFRICKNRKPTLNQNSTDRLAKHNAYAFNSSGSNESDAPYSLLPASQSFTKFPILHFGGKRAMAKVSALKSPKGFGPAPKKKKKQQQRMTKEEEEEEEEEEDTVVPEVVTNRMMKRIGLSVGVPLAIGILFFPFFYYLKVVLKWDVPDWLPFIISTFTFGSAAVGITYGIMSTSWDPMREGSFLGWTEAQKNWPVFWQSVQGRGGRK